MSTGEAASTTPRSRQHPAGARSGAGPHSVAALLIPVPAMILILLSPGPWFPMACCLIGVLVLGCLRPRWTLIASPIWLGLSALTIAGMVAWLPQNPYGTPSAPAWAGISRDRWMAAVTAALRMGGLAWIGLAVAPLIRRRELAHALITQFHAPYRVVLACLLGMRFFTRMSDDLRSARQQLRLRLPRHLAPLAGVRLIIPLLAGSIRHADELALALESRAFGAHDTKTMRPDRRVRPSDLLWLLACWGVSGLLAGAFWHLT